VPADTAVAEVEGPAEELLSAERVLLNFLQRLCGVATRTREHVLALGSSPTRLLDTRKTTPGFRMLEKYAVGQGGGFNHRLGLFDRIMVKDNHLAAGAAGAADRLTAFVERARASRPDLLVEVEVDRLDQIQPVVAAGADIVLLDNFPLADLRAAIPMLRGAAWSEVSGGVTLATLPQIGALAPDFVSCGGITHAAPWCDLGLDWN
jgi:nicotinate-nucleotide pyrophosphorylase (carboxylating)